MNETICNVMIYGGVALAVVFAVLAVVLFVKLEIPKVIGDLTGSTAKKQIREIRERGYENVQGSGASKKDAIKAKDSSGKIEVRDIQTKSTRSGQLAREGRERYQQAVNAAKYTDNRQRRQQPAGDTPMQTENDYDAATDVLQDAEAYEEATDILQDADAYEEATDILHTADDSEEATDILTADDSEGATDILTADDGEGATDILTADDSEEATDILTAENVDEEATDILTAENVDEEATDVLTGGRNTETGRSHTLPAGFTILTDVVVTHTDETIEGGEE